MIARVSTMRAAVRRLKRRVLAARKDPLEEELNEALLISVNPKRIALYGASVAERRKLGNTYLRALDRRRRSRFILPGNWDLNCVPFRDIERYRFALELRRYRFDYTKCNRFLELMERIEAGEIVSYKNKGAVFRKAEDVHRYLQGHVEVCRSMIQFGYLPEKATDHICIMVGRNGELIKEVRGRHRLAIAQVFDVPLVVALVRHVHPLWVKSEAARLGRLPPVELLRRSLARLEAENRGPVDETECLVREES
jgi:hypothetical protein